MVNSSANRVAVDPSAASLDPTGEAIDPFALMVDAAGVDSTGM